MRAAESTRGPIGLAGDSERPDRGQRLTPESAVRMSGAALHGPFEVFEQVTSDRLGFRLRQEPPKQPEGKLRGLRMLWLAHRMSSPRSSPADSRRSPRTLSRAARRPAAVTV